MKRNPENQTKIVNAVLYKGNEKRCGVCGGDIEFPEQYRHESPDIWYHDDPRRCIAGLQHTVQTQNKIIEMLGTRLAMLGAHTFNFLDGLLKIKWGVIAKTRIVLYQGTLGITKKRGALWTEK